MAKRKRRKKKVQTDVWSLIESFMEDSSEIQESDYVSEDCTLPETDPIRSWDELIQIFREELYLTPGNETVLAVCLAATLSPFLPGEPIWIFLVGPASSGKTTLIQSFGDNNMYCVAQSQLHAGMLVSGFKSADGKDASFLPKLKKRTLFIKDYTTVVSMDHRSQEELYGILRDAFDGKFDKQYGNRETRNFRDLKFGMVAGVTRVIHGDARSSLGERFLKIEYIEEDEFDEHAHIVAAMRSYHRKEEREKRLQRATLGYLDHLITNLPSQEDMPEITPAFENRIIRLALLVSYLRAQVDRRGDDSLLYRPSKEIASRISVQLTKVAEALMLIYNKTEPDEMLYNAIKKLAINSCVPFNVEFAKAAYTHPGGVTRKQLETDLQIPSTNVHRISEDLVQLGILGYKYISNGSGKGGRNAKLYTLNPVIRTLWSQAIEGKKPIRKKKRIKRVPRTDATD